MVMVAVIRSAAAKNRQELIFERENRRKERKVAPSENRLRRVRAYVLCGLAARLKGVRGRQSPEATAGRPFALPGNVVREMAHQLDFLFCTPEHVFCSSCKGSSCVFWILLKILQFESVFILCYSVLISVTVILAGVVVVVEK